MTKRQRITDWEWWLRRLACLVVAALLFSVVLGFIMAQATNPAVGDAPAWSTPQSMAIKRLGELPSSQHESVAFNNLACQATTYRLTSSSAMHTGCFIQTAFGFLDPDNEVVIFNGTDEAVPLLSFSPHEALVPWPGAGDLVALDNLVTNGMYISLYKNPLAQLQDQRNLSLQVTAKQLTAPPELPLTDATGQRLVINPQTLTFSDGGSWLVAETVNGSFVRVNLATLAVTAFAPAYRSPGSPGLLQTRVAISRDGRYVALSNEVAGQFKVYDLVTCTAAADTTRPENCQAHDYRPFAQAQISGLNSIRQLHFVNDGLLSFEVLSSNSAASGLYELAPAGNITSLIDYLGLGDSYSAGEGAFDYVAGTDTADNACHLSLHSYPLLLTHDLFSSAGGHSVACSGAVLNDVGSRDETYRGQVRGVADFQHLEQAQSGLLSSVMTNYTPGYVAQQRFVGQYQPAIVTVSVGGNDIGFGDIIQNCVTPHISRHRSGNDCYNSYEERLELLNLIDRTVPRWTALYKQLAAAAPGTRLYAIGYPLIASDTGTCALNVNLSKSELEFAQELIMYLNNSIEQAASLAGIPYIDISQALAGHRLCETSSNNIAVNGLTAGKDGGPLGTRIFGKESYHPNALGQELMEQSILEQTHNLTATVAPAAGAGVVAIETLSQNLLQAPKSGRAIYLRVPDDTLTSSLVSSTHSTAVQINGTRDGLEANASYVIHVDGPTGLVLTTVTTNNSGDLTTTITVPPSTVPGGHTIDITGNNQAGEPVDVTQPVYVPVSDTDSDGDGLADTDDSCPGAVNSGVDSDQDGIDDSCDNLIGPVMAGSGQGSGGDAAAGLGGSSGGTDVGSSSNSVGIPLVPDSSNPPGIPLDPPPGNAIDDFADTGDPLTVAAIRTDAGAASELGEVLGSQAANPIAVTKQASVMPHPATRPTTAVTPPGAPPHSLHWLFWAKLAGLAWLIVLLLILYLLMKRFTDRPKRHRRPEYG